MRRLLSVVTIFVVVYLVAYFVLNPDRFFSPDWQQAVFSPVEKGRETIREIGWKSRKREILEGRWVGKDKEGGELTVVFNGGFVEASGKGGLAMVKLQGARYDFAEGSRNAMVKKEQSLIEFWGPLRLPNGHALVATGFNEIHNSSLPPDIREVVVGLVYNEIPEGERILWDPLIDATGALVMYQDF